ncbi:hypothetical protein GRF59_19920 [Paenibacillus sp. HJL G12]|uniref:DUF1700 domain-containing protein n=1 Tax=Paenibacillus dendrobii TaxID=2691084 RepID=A0A7X3IL11_9BACL|nr:permease prefix domain 1-containing protein [Paenibacillus dendrobii]MWV45888.1 hypothetical protein [Paenibacillus dendrobii]
MNAELESYLEVVYRHLPRSINREDVVAELRAHLEEAAMELRATGMGTAEAVNLALSQMPHPRKLALAYRSGRPLPAAVWSAALLSVNGLCFAAGTWFIISHRLGSTPASYGFQLLAAQKEWVLLMYTLIWLLSGFMLGRKYGAQAEKCIRRIIILPLLPNYLFMLLVLFRIIPEYWFDSLLSLPFILLCVGATFMFGHLVRMGCKWGKSAALNHG